MDIKKRLFKVSSHNSLCHLPKFFIYLSLLFLISCSFSVLHLDINASHQLNRGANYRSLPVVVRIYTLKNPEGFSDATFRELWHNDKKILGNNLVSRQEFTVVPGKTLHLSLSKNNRANYLGAVALFRHPGHNMWRALIPLPLFSASLTLSGNRIVLN